MKIRLAALAFVFTALASITVVKSESAGFGSLDASGCNCHNTRR